MNNKSQFDLEPAPVNDVSAEPARDVPEFFFSTPAHVELLEQLTHAAQHSSSILVVEGSYKSGKSTLARVLCRTNLGQYQVGFVTASVQTGPRPVLRAVATSFGLSVNERMPPSELLAILRHFCQQLRAQSRVAALVIDDADALDPRVVMALASLVRAGASSGWGLRLVLWSEPGWLERLEEMQLADITIREFEVPLLTCGEVGALLQQLPVWSRQRWGKLSFKPAVVQRIWVASGGCIGLVKDMADEELNQQKKANKSSAMNFAGLPFGHVVVLSVLIVALIGVLWSRDSGVSGVAAVTTDNAQNGPGDSMDSVLVKEPEKPARLIVESLSVPVDEPIANPDAAFDPTASVEPVINPRDLRQALYGRQPVALEPTNGQQAEIVSEPVPTPVARVESRPAVDETPGAGDIARLLTFDPTSYSLQVMAASSRKSLERVRDAQDSKLPLYVYETRRRGQQWFVLLMGNYPSRDAAVDAVQELPPVLRSGGPWPRQLERIHAEIGEDGDI